MENVALKLIEWGTTHYWFFGWTLFWGTLLVGNGVFTVATRIINLLNRIPRSINIMTRGWPPTHLDADGDPIKKTRTKETKPKQTKVLTPEEEVETGRRSSVL